MHQHPSLYMHYLTNPHVFATRVRTTEGPWIRALLDGELGPEAVLGFLIQFCALGVRMVEGVDGWMVRAGQACVRLGRRELGESIIERAAEEAGHDSMLVEDLFELAPLWRERAGHQISAENLLSQPPPRSVLRYAEIHEEVIASAAPWAQLGIEYEIETMSTVVGPPLIQRCREDLGDEIMQGLSFVRAHVELDDEHTLTNAARIDELLAREPALGRDIARAGAAALDAYLEFLSTCVELGVRMAGDSSPRWSWVA
ncbi:hypothetical protein G6O69_34650 [Pseudenhygromyxa sp. WMMC2535]|uniref:iron-containing redox enzyme family protein n=1 Tax=Pseudenhygromyxa sp. WMMC2535 TaxID=2712867 RepID=UPI001557AC80|nr:iron-containing redox enzyme family protein [Pseudenhygromyxa sp. WMMC2535]NVB43014.1 hypothetical protein [Pseudenhygromyxa sp. WMMC2535]